MGESKFGFNYFPLDNFGTEVGENPDCLLLSGTVVGENPDHVCWVNFYISSKAVDLDLICLFF